MQWVTILGATGSIGLSTLDVIGQHPERFAVFALTAHRNVAKMASLVQTYRPRYAVMLDEAAAAELRHRLGNASTEVLDGRDALQGVATDAAVNIVVAGIVGAAGLEPTLAAVRAAKRVLLANKEALIMAGSLFMTAVTEHRAELLPVDSEHNAIFQCLPENFDGLDAAGVRRLLLTGSGGPFRTTPAAELAGATPQQACAHPNWNMGRKISVDSATMMNKGLEFIEACWLFAARADQVEVVVHPQSIVHSMVEYVDGSVVAQLGQPDMRTPIAYCLGWPERIASAVQPLDFYNLSGLEFCAPDPQRFPCLFLAMAAAREGGTSATALNAANEVAVDAFLQGCCRFTAIAEVVDCVMQTWNPGEPDSLDAVIAADREARRLAQDYLNQR